MSIAAQPSRLSLGSIGCVAFLNLKIRTGSFRAASSRSFMGSSPLASRRSLNYSTQRGIRLRRALVGSSSSNETWGIRQRRARARVDPISQGIRVRLARGIRVGSKRDPSNVPIAMSCRTSGEPSIMKQNFPTATNPRNVMQLCSASITTPTPCGWRITWMASDTFNGTEGVYQVYVNWAEQRPFLVIWS